MRISMSSRRKFRAARQCEAFYEPPSRPTTCSDPNVPIGEPLVRMADNVGSLFTRVRQGKVARVVRYLRENFRFIGH